MSEHMKLYQVHFCSNTFMLANAFFRCVIAQFTKKQCDELKKTCELLTARKMVLGDNLPRKLLHIKTSALGEDLIEPKILLNI